MSSVFSKIDHNKFMLEGSYKKLKSYYYYNKNFLYMRKKIAEYEFDLAEMDDKFVKLANLLAKPDSKKSKELVNSLLSQVNFYVLPKSFESRESKESKKKVVSNSIDTNKQIKKVNFFINIPIELHILDTLWTILLGKVSYDQKLLLSNCYGNTLNNYVLYNSTEDFTGSINFDNNRLFNIYFYKYIDWRNNAFKQLESNYGQKHSLLLSLDIKSYYYSVKLDFKKINIMFNNDPHLNSFRYLTNLFEKVFQKYAEIIKPYFSDMTVINKKSLPLPIGLFSSMLLGNIYLRDFDSKVFLTNDVSYYGRYVDDILIVFDADNVEDTSISSVISGTLIKNELLVKTDNNTYTIYGKSNLKVQNEKIKIIHIDPKESKAIIDVYNKNVKINPSQMNVLPDYDLNITDFEESAYIIENLTHDRKLRDIGNMSVNGFKVSRYLSTLVMKQKSIDYNSEQKGCIDEQIKKIYKFFRGNQSIEYYSNWLNILYFFMLKGDVNEIKKFCKRMRDNINKLKFDSLDNELKKKPTIGRKTKEALSDHLFICVCTALALRSNLLRNMKNYCELTEKLQKSNMFNHYLTSYPLINYIDNKDKPIYLATIALKDIAKYDRNIHNSFKIKWSPRFIKLEELFLYWFIYKFDGGGNTYFTTKQKKDIVQEIIDRFYEINFIKSKSIDIKVNNDWIINGYVVQDIKVSNNRNVQKDKLKIAVANIKIKAEDCSNVLRNPWSTLTQENKRQMFQILEQSYGDIKNKVDILVLPEFYMPLKWLSEVIDFSRKSQIAVITGIQYITDTNRNAYNYIATILPFENQRYKNAFLLIREKNDYSPIEKIGLAEKKFKCEDAKIPIYQVYNWNDIDFGTFLCYEFTDIAARSLYKAKVDILFAPEFNSDTTYFSNIIETSVRDLHTIIVQANTSIYGDSRITGPYSRDYRNIVQIKGGDNNGLIIGTINLLKLQRYQASYDYDLKQQIYNTYNKIVLKDKKQKDKSIKDKIKISKLPARYDTKRVKDNLE